MGVCSAATGGAARITQPYQWEVGQGLGQRAGNRHQDILLLGKEICHRGAATQSTCSHTGRIAHAG